MKKALALILCLVMLLGVFPMYAAFAEGETISGSGKADTGISNVEEKTYANATIDQDFAEDRVIVVLKHNLSDMKKTPDKKMFGSVKVTEVEDLTSISKYGNTKSADELPLLNKDGFHQILLLKLPSKDKKAVLEAIKEIEKNDDVLYVGPDYVIHMDPPETVEVADSVDAVSSVTPIDTNDPFFRSGYQWGLEKIQAPQAWNITKGSNSVKVGVICRGLAMHEDLKDNLVTGYDFEHDNEYANEPGCSTHGTHCAGILGACTNNGKGIAGVAWNVSIVPLQIYEVWGGTSDDAEAFISNLGAAVAYCTEKNIPIILHEFEFFYDVLYYAFQNYNGLVVVPATNHSQNMDESPSTTYMLIPTLSNVIIVGNSTQGDTMRASSNYGKNTVHLFAPGTDILSCYTTDEVQDSYEYFSGTSMSAPFVAGVAALIRSIRPYLPAARIKQLILDNVDKVSN